MQSFFHLLLSHPSSYSALLSEIDAASLSDPVTYAEAQNLPYFQACLKEAMRLRPAVGLNITRFVPPGGLEIDGTHVPGDVEVAVNGWVLHRDREVFGADAERYRPERWLEGKSGASGGAKVKEMERHMYQVSQVVYRSFPTFVAPLLTLLNLIVRRWCPPLHRSEPGSARDQQATATAAAAVSVRACSPRETIEA